MDYTVDH